METVATSPAAATVSRATRLWLSAFSPRMIEWT